MRLLSDNSPTSRMCMNEERRYGLGLKVATSWEGMYMKGSGWELMSKARAYMCTGLTG